ncbi:MAG: EAL domain-containing protein [Rhodocyclaceae bacterium]
MSAMALPAADPLPDPHTILVVDDMPANLGLLVDQLETLGHHVVVALDGEEALQRAQRVRPDLILLDVMMPGIDGFETCRRLKALDATRDIPVIFMTVLDDAPNKLLGFSAGGVDYVTKPLQLPEVLARVTTHLELRAAQQRVAARNLALQQEIAVREQAEADLQRAQDELERRVEERTAELARVNASLAAEIAERERAALLRAGENRILEMVVTNSSLEDMLAELVRLIELQHAGTLCSILLLAADGLHVRRGVAPSLPAAFIDALDGLAIGPNAGACGAAMYRREIVVVSDVREDPLCADCCDLAAAHDLRACWSAPIMSHDEQVLGSFAIYHHVVHTPDDAERQLIDFATRIARIAIEHRRTQERIRYMADHDALTGLANRTVLRDRVQQAIAQAHRNRCMVALLFIDLDNFKHINDSLGHRVGDRLLQEAANRLTSCLREGDSVARIGGDEFVIVLPALTDGTDAARAGTKVEEALTQAFFVDEHELHISGSIGISLFPADGADVESLMRAADSAMYHAKDKGRSNYQFFTPLLNLAVQRRMAIANRLRQALASHDFLLHYQPQVDLQSGKIFSAEALLRWGHPGMDPIGSSEFIPIAEDTGLIVPIGAWALREACTQLMRWRAAGHPALRIAVNLSVRQFHQEGFQELAARILADSGLPAEALDLEITESLLMLQNSENLALMERLAGMGIELSVDDFGTGYSSLAYLQRFPIRTLKIDQSFINGIGQDENDTAIVTAILAMAQSLHLKVVAEGVETLAQETFLKKHGCQAAQGYYYSAPVSAEDFGAMLEREAA